MSPTVIVAIQSTLGLVVFATLCRQYLLDRMRRSDVFVVIAPVLLMHAVRALGLTFLAPGQVSVTQDMEAMEVIAYGDLSAAVTGTLAALAAYRRSALTVPLAWLLTVVGLGDFVVVGITVASSGVLDEGIGAMWLTFGLVAPVLVLSHVYVVYALLTRRSEFAVTSGARGGRTRRPDAVGAEGAVAR